MQEDFHYYATYCAAYIAGYSHDECLEICYSDQFVDCCSKTILAKIKAPVSAATTQTQMELMNVNTDVLGLQDITRIWSSFHFLPYDLYAKLPHRPKLYMRKYRLLCNTNGELVAETVKLAKDKSLQAAGIAMHVLSDTWAHRYFIGSPSIVINDVNSNFFEIVRDGEEFKERKVDFSHNVAAKDDFENGKYINSLPQPSENSIMNLGHGRAGHLPDYSFARYRYMPAWGDYAMVTKDNPSDYMHAFTQMIYALKYLRGVNQDFELDKYDMDAIADIKSDIEAILEKRQLIACEDWKQLGERLSGKCIDDFDVEKYQNEYINAEKQDKDETRMGHFIIAAMAQKSMVTNKIYKSGSKLAGVSVDFEKSGFKGISDYKKLVETAQKKDSNE